MLRRLTVSSIKFGDLVERSLYQGMEDQCPLGHWQALNFIENEQYFIFCGSLKLALRSLDASWYQQHSGGVGAQIRAVVFYCT
jgi:hypothetical protein